MIHNKQSQKHLDGLRLTSRKELVSYFTSKLKELYKCGIYNLVDSWNKVLWGNKG